MEESLRPGSPPILIIGFGNPLRGDDAAGPLAAEAVERWRRPDIRTITAHQLLPEMAEPLAACRLAIFVDARHAGDRGDVFVQPVEPSAGRSGLAHASDPGRLLALAQCAFGSRPQAWVVTIPATDLDHGDRLSPEARRGLEHALRRIAALVEPPPESPGPGVRRPSSCR